MRITALLSLLSFLLLSLMSCYYPIDHNAKIPFDIQVVGSYAYISYHSKLYTLDISDPGSPSRTSKKDLFVSSKGIKANGLNLYVIYDGVLKSYDTGLAVYDISSPSLPTHIGNCTLSEHPQSIHLEDKYAYIFHTDNISIVDVSTPLNCTVISSWEIPDGWNKDCYINDNIAYIVGSIPPKMKLVDLSDPDNVTLLSSIDIPDSRARGICKLLSHAYVLSQDGFYIYDVSDPLDPVLVGTNSSITGDSLLVVDSYAYLTRGDGFIVIDISNPANPRQVSKWGESNKYKTDIFISGTTLFLTGDGPKLWIVDISNPLAPLTLSSYYFTRH